MIPPLHKLGLDQYRKSAKQRKEPSGFTGTLANGTPSCTRPRLVLNKYSKSASTISPLTQARHSRFRPDSQKVGPNRGIVNTPRRIRVGGKRPFARGPETFGHPKQRPHGPTARRLAGRDQELLRWSKCLKCTLSRGVRGRASSCTRCTGTVPGCLRLGAPPAGVLRISGAGRAPLPPNMRSPTLGLAADCCCCGAGGAREASGGVRLRFGSSSRGSSSTSGTTCMLPPVVAREDLKGKARRSGSGRRNYGQSQVKPKAPRIIIPVEGHSVNVAVDETPTSLSGCNVAIALSPSGVPWRAKQFAAIPFKMLTKLGLLNLVCGIEAGLEMHVAVTSSQPHKI